MTAKQHYMPLIVSEYGRYLGGKDWSAVVSPVNGLSIESNDEGFIRFLAKAANCHEELLSLLRELEIEATHINTLHHAENEIGPFLWSELYETCARARAAIAKVEGGTQ